MTIIQSGLKKLKISLAYRIPVLIFKNWLTHISPVKFQLKEINSEYNLLTLCGAKDYPLLKQALLSIHRSFGKLPHLYVVTDFGTSVGTWEKISKLYPANLLHIIPADNCIKYHEENGNTLLKNYALKSPMGLKLAAILQISALGLPLFYSDTDVLWFNDPAGDLKQLIESQINIHMSYDYYPGYDYDLIENANLKITSEEKPYYNAGIIFLKNATGQQLAIIERLLSFVAEKHNNLTEQTIFAYLQKISGPSLLSADKYLMYSTDQFALRPSFKENAVARHYIGQIRHMFWRDAFFLKNELN
ncbi:MAG TPA: putative nucleotide-diphospho-sugar transferase [Mucilaginibacter sp.]|jgi:hypothetical protein|nr:putative nucleotide-diphospho-sugar transferase [Mucilaginibacter sp.]